MALAALVALAVLVSCSNDDSQTRTEASPAGAGSTTTLQPETRREIQDRVTSDNPQGDLDPGTYVVDVDGLHPRPVVELPKGFRFDTFPEMARFSKFATPDCTLSKLACRWTGDEGRPIGRLKVGFWNGEQIMVHPALCGRFEDFKRPGPSVDDLATTLAGLPGFRAADPAPVSLGGYDGLYVELVTVAPSCPLFWLTSPTGIDLPRGAKARNRIPHLADNAVRGHVERLWILGAEGGRLVVEASHEPGATADQVSELTRIVESVTFPHTE